MLTDQQTTLIGGTLVGALLSGFYVSLKRRQSKKEQLGQIPHCEQCSQRSHGAWRLSRQIDERVLAHNVTARPKSYRGEVITPPNSPG